MNEKNEENLKELLDRFGDEDQTRQSLEDFSVAEAIFERHPAPTPDKQLLTDIKANVARMLIEQKRAQFRRAIYRVVSVAAVFIIVSISAVIYFQPAGEPVPRVALMDSSEWESDNPSQADAGFTVLTAQMDQIEDELLAIELDESGDGAYGDMSLDLETEFIEIDGDFWKG